MMIDTRTPPSPQARLRPTRSGAALGAGLALALALGGCALPGRPVAGLAAADLASAQAIAKAGGDTQGTQCWGDLLPAVQAFQSGTQIGPAAKLEIYRVAVIEAEGPCAPIALPLVAKLAPLLTAGGLLAAGL
jgi:hypothetical protein